MEFFTLHQRHGEKRESLARSLHKLVAIVTMVMTIVQAAGADGSNAVFSVPTASAATGIFAPINYQGKISAINGTAVADGKYNMRFKIFDAATGGTKLWEETWNGSSQQVTMTGGLFSVALGSQVAMTGSVNFNSDNLYLQVEFDPANAGTYPEVFSPRRRFGSVPYAHNADTLDGLDSSKFIRKDQSETASGTLTIKPNDASKIGLDILSTAGASTTAGLRISTQGAADILFGSGGTNYDVNLYRFTANVLKTDDSLYVAGTMSGSVLHAEKTLTTSGTLVFEGAASGSSLYLGTSLKGAGLVDCSTGTTSKLLWNSSTGRFSCGTDQSGGLSSSGQVIAIGDARYVKKSGDTMTGALVINVTNGIASTIGLKVMNTMSGAMIHAEKSLTSSGTLVFEGAASGSSLYLGTSLNGAGLVDCSTATTSKLLWNSASGRFSCGTDQNTTYTAGQGLALNGTAFSLNTTITGSLVRFTTLSGSLVHASTTLSSSGTITAEGAISGASLFAGTSIKGAGLTDCSSGTTSKLLWSSSTGRFSCGTDQTNSFSSGQVLAIGDARYVKKSGDTMTGALNIRPTAGVNTTGLNVAATMSGRALVIEGTGSQPLLTTNVKYGTMLMGTGDVKTGSGLMYPQLDIAGRTPVLMKTLSTNGSPQSIYVQGRYAYVPNYSAHSMQIIDISSPVSPVIVKTVNTGTNPIAVSAQGNFAYVVDYQSNLLQVFDVSNPAAAVIVGTGSTDSRPYNLFVQGRYAYVVNSSSNTLQVFDVSNPAKPTMIGTVATGAFPSSVYVQGRYAYVTNNGLTNTLQVFDISVPTKPVSVGSKAASGPIRVAVQGSFAYVVNTTNQTMQVFNISNPSSITSVGSVGIGLSPSNIFIQGRYAYVSNNGSDTVSVIDISSPAQPVVVNTLSTQTGPTGVFVSGRYLYVANASNASMQIFDLGGAYIQQLEVGGIEAGSLNVRQNIQGMDMALQGGLTVGQSLIVSGNVSFGTGGVVTISQSGAMALNARGTISGSTIYATNALRSSGSIVAEGTISGANLFAATSFSGAGLTTCNGSSNALRWSGTTGRFSCGTITSGTSFSSGQVMSIGDARYVKKSGDTMTGALTINVTGGNVSTIGLKVLNTMSGAIVHAEKTLASSGTLVFEGAASGSSLYLGTSLNGAGLTTCSNASTSKLLWNSSTGRFSCGTDQTGTTFGSGQVIAIGDARYVKKSGDTMTGALTINVTNGSLGTIGLKVLNTMSGAIIHAEKQLTSSGQIIGKQSGTSVGSGVLTIANNTRYGTGAYIYSSGAVLALDSNHPNAQNAPHLLFGYKGNFDTNLYRFAANILKTDDSLYVVNTVSGALVHADTSLSSSGTLTVKGIARFQNNVNVVGTVSGSTVYAINSLRSSGSIVAEGTISGANLFVGTSITGAGLTNCNSSNNALQWSSSTGRFGCGTLASGGVSSGQVITIGDARYVKKSGDTMTGALNIRPTAGVTAIGLNVAAVMSGRALTIEGTGSTPILSTSVRKGEFIMGVETGSDIQPQLNITGRLRSPAVGSGTVGIDPQTIVINGNRAYVGAQGAKLYVLDITNPLKPTPITNVSTNGNATWMTTAGRYLYALNGLDMQIFDISKEGAPVLVSTTRPASAPLNIAIQGRYAYVTESSGSLVTYDVSNPASPVQTGSGSTGVNPLGLATDGRYAYVSNYVGSNIQVFDMQDPAHITRLATLSAAHAPYNIAAQGRYLYVTEQSAGAGGFLQIIDVSNPSSPVSVSTSRIINEPGNYIVVQGRYAYVSEANSFSIQSLDISNPSAPSLVSTVSTSNTGLAPEQMAVKGRYLYVTEFTSPGTIQVYDLGGAYVQQLEAGGIETNALNVRTTIQGLDASLQGNLTVSQSLVVNGSTSFGSGGQVLIGGYTGAVLNARGTVSGSVIYATNALRSSGSIIAEGAISGASLFIGTSIKGAGLTSCNSANNFLQWNSTTGRFSCGTTSGGTGSGNIVAIGDARYVKKSGDTMTGALTINVTSGNVSTIGLKVLNTMSGAIVHAEKTLSSSGTLVFEGAASGSSLYLGTSLNGAGLTDCSNTVSSKLLWNSATGRFSCGTDQSGSSGLSQASGDLRYVKKSGDTMTGALTINVTGGNVSTIGLKVLNTMSGAIVHAEKTLSTSGTLVFEGAASGSSLYLGTSLNGAGLTSCNSANNALQWNSTTGRFSCGTITSGTSFSSGQVIAIGDARYVKKSGDTMTGALTINVTGGTNGTIGLKVINTFSGAVVHAEKNLTSSGTLNIKGIATFQNNVNVAGTVSGSTVYAINSLRSSGSIVAEGTISGANLFVGTSIKGAGLSNCTTSTSALQWNSTTGRFSCGASVGFSSGQVLAIGDARYVKKSGDTMTGALTIRPTVGINTVGLNVAATMSGRAIIIEGTGSVPLMTTQLSYGTIVMGTGAYRNLTGASLMEPQLNVRGRVPSVRIGSGSTGTNPYDVAVVGRYAYVVNNTSNTLQVLDVNDPSHPTSVGSVSTASSPANIRVQGNIAYVGLGGTTNLQMFDIGNPSTPVKIGTYTKSVTTTRGIAVQGRYVYLLDTGDLTVLDVSNPKAPILMGSATISSGNARQIAIQGHYAYITNGSTANTLQIFDVSNPTAPVSVGSVSTGASSNPQGIAVEGRYAYVTGFGTSNIHIFDISNPTSPVAAGTITTTINPIAISVQDRMAYVLSNTAIDFVDVSNPSTPYKIGSVSLTASSNAQFFTVSGRYAFVPDYGLQSLSVYDLGGAYVQAMEAGTLEATSLNIRAGIYGMDLSLQGSAMIAGSLVVTGDASFGSGGLVTVNNKGGSGAFAIHETNRTQTGAYIGSSGTGAPVLVLEAGTQSGTQTPDILFGYKGKFDTKITRTGTGALTFNSSTGVLLTLNTGMTNTKQDVFRIISQVSNGKGTPPDNLVFRVNASGAVFSDSAFHSNGADYAEWFYAGNSNLVSGEVVCIDVTKNNAVKRCSRDGDSDVMGVVSTNPAFIGNTITGAEGLMPPGYALVGLIGQVPTRVIVDGTGAIRPGDPLTAAATPGFARKARPGESTLGVALEGIDHGTGTINVLISRRNSSLTVDTVSQKVLDTVASMKIGDEVQIMVANAVQNLNVNDQVDQEVQKQISALQATSASIQTLQAEINDLKNQLSAMSGERVAVSTGSDVAQTGSQLTAHSSQLFANTLSLEKTLNVGGDTHIGGDLHLDGALVASDIFVPNGIAIDGGATVNGDLTAQTVHANAGATVDGMLTVNGNILINSGSLLFGSGTLNLSDLIVQHALYVLGDITINGLATFLGDVSVHGELSVSNRQAGFAVIPKTGTAVTVLFGSGGFRGSPVVTASPDFPVLYAVSKTTQTGFTIMLAGPAPANITFSWLALTTNMPTTQTGTALPDNSLIFPLASDNIPVSSDMVWNACIRNTPIFDATGKALSCSRYHDSYTWHQPDLKIDFLWNTDLTPPLLVLPDGYTSKVTEDATALRAAFNGPTDDGTDASVSSTSSVSSDSAASSDASLAIEPVTTDPTTTATSSTSSDASTSSAAAATSVAASTASAASAASIAPVTTAAASSDASVAPPASSASAAATDTTPTTSTDSTTTAPASDTTGTSTSTQTQ